MSPRPASTALRYALKHVIAVRQVTLSELGRARLGSCTKESLLTVWLERALTASSEAEVFTGSESA